MSQKQTIDWVGNCDVVIGLQFKDHVVTRKAIFEALFDSYLPILDSEYPNVPEESFLFDSNNTQIGYVKRRI